MSIIRATAYTSKEKYKMDETSEAGRKLFGVLEEGITK
jgi:hypothetical protein